jgi:hypothetical protein
MSADIQLSCLIWKPAYNNHNNTKHNDTQNNESFNNLSVFLLNVTFMPSVIMANVVILSVVAPEKGISVQCYKILAMCSLSCCIKI